MLTYSIINLLGIKDKHVEIFDVWEEQGVCWFELHTLELEVLSDYVKKILWRQLVRRHVG